MSLTISMSTSFWNCQLPVSSIPKSLSLHPPGSFPEASGQAPSSLLHGHCHSSFQGQSSRPRWEILPRPSPTLASPKPLLTCLTDMLLRGFWVHTPLFSLRGGSLASSAVSAPSVDAQLSEPPRLGWAFSYSLSFSLQSS